MRKFLKNTFTFIITFSSILVFVFLVNNGSFIINYERFEPKIFNKKVETFAKFIQNHESINLVLGSSVVEHSVIPDSLGPNWFAFAHGGQNIYESYKFINYYKDVIKIDSIVIGIQAFDFPYSYIKNRTNQHPYLNGNFSLFGNDSITSIDLQSDRMIFQIIKEQNYPNIKNILGQKHRTLVQPNQDVWSDQGYSGLKFDKPINLNNLFKNEPNRLNQYLGHFANVKEKPNYLYFNLFNNLVESLDIKVIYIIIPTPNYRQITLAKYGYDKIWKRILESLEKMSIEVWDFENGNDLDGNFLQYIDENHMSYNSAKYFTKIIKTKLINKKN